MFDPFGILAPIYERLIPPPDPRVLGELLELAPSHALLDAAGGTGRVAGVFAASVSGLSGGHGRVLINGKAQATVQRR